MADAAVLADEASGAHTLTLTRRFAAPIARVWAAWTERDRVAAWFGPEPITRCTVHEWDLRPGGDYSLTMHGADGDFDLIGTFRTVAPPHRLVCTWQWSGDNTGLDGVTTLLTVELADAGDATDMRLTHARLPSALAAERHQGGWTSSLVKLARLLAAD